MTVRYAIRFTTEHGVGFHLQGLPRLEPGDSGFAFAVLYATHKHAVESTRKMRRMIEAIKSQGGEVHIVEVKCELGAESVV